MTISKRIGSLKDFSICVRVTLLRLILGKYMDSKTQIIEQYFKLSDLVSNDKQALHEIIQLFSKGLWSSTQD